MGISLPVVIVIGLVSWRIASLLKEESGPFDILSKFRHLIGFRYVEPSGELQLSNELALMISCVWCSSLWIAFGLSLLMYAWPVAILNALGASTISILVDRLIND